MIPRHLSLALAAVVLSPALACAQYTTWTPKLPPEANQEFNRRMYEDVEIFRRVLDRRLQPFYPTHGAMAFGMGGMQGGMMGMQGSMMGMGGMMGGGMGGGMIPFPTSVSTLEGVYLEGQGVVYTATLASLQSGTRTKPSASPVSDWERARREVRNEKDEPKKTEPSKPARFSDLLLELLAENGHHFSQLRANESLTIVVTVHERKPDKRLARSQAQASAPRDEVAVKVRDLELMGDLHLKQGRAEEALATFLKAWEMKPGSREGATLQRKMAQAYLMLDQLDKARAALERAEALRKEHQDAQDKPAAEAAAVSLPTKLIVSVPKKLLDEAGKLTPEEFRSRATVETLTFDGR